MAKFSIFAIFAILAVMAVKNAQSDEPTCICTRIMRPVCGSDGVTYSNRCELNCAAKRKTGLTEARVGRCEETKLPRKFEPKDGPSDLGSNCFCTREFSPVCASNGKTYSNPCEFGCAQRQRKGLEITKTGPCEDVPKEL
ncbi:unnamed protein product [Allacma fusca]|uniref:Kazal-like domain-containing protein n=1 Tax=Allacma fusca TaxID=39272 RepID=A0A8J2LSH5_9HEXA|nr:unnamed protein product [Allacma fusca]